MIRFERDRDPKSVLGIGLFEKLPKMMEDDPGRGVYNIEDPVSVWEWALERNNKIVLKFIVSQHGKGWYKGKVDVGAYANEMLWEAVSYESEVAVDAILKIPGLFPEEAMSLDFGTCKLKGEYTKRGDTEFPMRTALFGNLINLAKTHGTHKIEELLENYYHSEIDRIRKRKKS